MQPRAGTTLAYTMLTEWARVDEIKHESQPWLFAVHPWLFAVAFCGSPPKVLSRFCFTDSPASMQISQEEAALKQGPCTPPKSLLRGEGGWSGRGTRLGGGCLTHAACLRSEQRSRLFLTPSQRALYMMNNSTSKLFAGLGKSQIRTTSQGILGQKSTARQKAARNRQKICITEHST